MADKEPEGEMIELTRLNGRPIIVNAELVESIEQTPDCVLSLVHGKKIVVLETPEQVTDRVIAYRRRIAGSPAPVAELAAMLTRSVHRHED
jgi:flagellar protein FlbD